MFNLDQAISKWRKKLDKHPGLEPGYIEELENHLRDKIESLSKQGYSEEEAFEQAISQFNDVEEIADEFHKARSKKGTHPPWKTSRWVPTMLPNHIKMALRVIRKQKQFSIINVLGLSIGLACCLLIFLYIYNQLQYDQFHPDSSRLYRVTYEVSKDNSSQHYAVSVPALIPTLRESYPEIEKAVRVSIPQEHVVEIESKLFNEQNYYHADSTFFDLFGYTLIQGNPQTALVGPGKVVLSRSTAEKYFGERNAIGETLSVNYGQTSTNLEVTGVAATEGKLSHLTFDLLVSLETLQKYYPTVNDQNWWLRSVYSYVKLSDKECLQNKLPKFVNQNLKERMEQSGFSFSFHLQPVTDIHLHSDLQQEIQANGNILYIYLFGSIAFLILLIACFNYMNLATARYAQRAQEVGVRKSLGANRWDLIKQFIGESLLFTLIAIILSILLAWFAHPVLELFTGQSIGINSVNFTWIVLVLPIIWLITGIISGSYPAFFLSSFESTEVLKKTFQRKNSGSTLRKILVVVQFAISVILVIGAGVIYSQLNYVENKPLGYERNQVLTVLNSPGLFSTAKPVTIQQNFNSHPSIQNVAFASQYPTHTLSNNTKVSPEGASKSAQYNITLNHISTSYQDLLQLEIVEGRNFSQERPTDSTAYIINEAAVEYFGWTNPIGKEFRSVTSGERLGEVIGVFKNYHTQSLHKKIEPVIYTLGSPSTYDYTLVKLKEENVSSAIQFLEEQWETLSPGIPFGYSFLDNQYESQYRSEKQLAQLIVAFSTLAILIACLGLFGLAAYSTERRTKEIGIRKVFGASISSIVTLLSKDFLKLILIAFGVALPLAWFLVQQWLQNFAYHVEVGVGIFSLAGLITIAIALATVSWQSIKAALMNPADSLRSE